MLADLSRDSGLVDIEPGGRSADHDCVVLPSREATSNHTHGRGFALSPLHEHPDVCYTSA